MRKTHINFVRALIALSKVNTIIFCENHSHKFTHIYTVVCVSVSV